MRAGRSRFRTRPPSRPGWLRRAPRSASLDAVEFRLLGPPEVIERRRALDLGPGKQRALLAILLLHANEVVSAARLIDDLWPEEAPRTATKSIQVYVSGLRKQLGEGRLVTRKPGYLLRVEADELDGARFERIVSEAREAAPERAAARLREALALWRGPPLADLADEHFARPEIARLDGLRLAALEHRIDADLEAGRHAEVVGELEALVIMIRLVCGPIARGDYPWERRAALSREALEMARRIGDPETLAFAIDGHIPVVESPANTRELLDQSTELLRIALEVGDLERIFEAHDHRLERLFELGEMGAASAELGAMARVAERLRQPTQSALVTGCRARLALHEGRLEDAAELIDAGSSATGEGSDTAKLAFTFQLQRHLLERELGRLGAAAQLVRRSIDAYPDRPIWRCALAQLEAELAHEDEVRRRSTPWPLTASPPSSSTTAGSRACASWRRPRRCSATRSALRSFTSSCCPTPTASPSPTRRSASARSPGISACWRRRSPAERSGATPRRRGKGEPAHRRPALARPQPPRPRAPVES